MTPVSLGEAGDHPSLSHLVQLSTWNVQGKPLNEVMDFLEASSLDFDVLCLQEVTAPNLHDQSFQFLEYPALDVTVLLAKPPGCFRACALVLDSSHLRDVARIRVGHSHLCAVIPFAGWGQPVCVACARFPHSGRSLEELADALQAFEQDMEHMVGRRRPTPVLLLGDLNVGLLGDASCRAHMVLSSLLGLGLHNFSGCTCPTRCGSHVRLDHIVYSDSFLSTCRFIAPEEQLPWVVEEYCWEAQRGLKVVSKLEVWFRSGGW